MKQVVDVQKLRIVEVDDAAAPSEQLSVEILIAGGSVGGVSAAIAACEAGRTVCLTEETDWLGGQATSQGVSALDENRYIETTGGTRGYLAFRRAIRDWYRQNAKLKPEAAATEHLNPGRGWVSRLCFEPRAAVQVIEQRLAPFVVAGRLRILKRCKPCGLTKHDGRIATVDFVDLDSRHRYRVACAMVVDATELGDLLALGGAGFITGAESREQTGEPHAADTHDPEDVQSFTYPVAIELCAGEKHPIACPPDYEHYRTEQPYTMTIVYATRGSVTYKIHERVENTYGPFWTYRRLIDAAQFDDPRYPRDVSMINWPGNDYRGGNILVDSPAEQIAHLQAGKNLSLGLLYWLQHELDRDEGGKGYPEFKLRTDVTDSADGMSKFPYIRESRRIKALKTIIEQELVASAQQGPRAAHFDDSVGIGLYAIDIHESKRGRKQIIDPAKPFQIPLGALISRDTANLLAGCKNIGTTHISNGCYREHPIEWAIGEAAGETAALCLERGATPAAIRENPTDLRTLQRRLVLRGAPLMWYDDVTPDDPRFARVQMLPFEEPAVLDRLGDSLHAP